MPQKTFAIVTAVYNVGRYLPDFMASIENQDFDLGRLEVIAVNYGSTDDSLEILQQWAARRPDLVTVLSQPNAGQGSARNRGMHEVSAAWVTYTDPDDVIEPDYLTRVATFIEAHPQVPMIATNRILWDEQTGVQRRHPLAAMFKGGDQVVDLDRFPDYFHGSAPATFFRAQVIRDHDLRYDDRVQPNFEDGHFCVRYLFLTRPAVGFVASARYLYRKRADQSSTLQISLLDQRKFTQLPRHGYLDVLNRAIEVCGRVPEWLQNLVIYELSYYFTAELAPSASQSVASGAAGQEFLALAREIRLHLDDHVIESFRVRRVPSIVSQYLLHGLAGRDWHTDYVVLDRYDENRSLLRATYRYIGKQPEESFRLRGDNVQPIAGKLRTVRFFGEPAVVERIAWLSVSGTFEVRLDGIPLRLTNSWPGPRIIRLRQSGLRDLVAQGDDPRSSRTRDARKHLWRLVNPGSQSKMHQTKKSRRLAKLIASNPVDQLRFHNAWVLMDRIHDADDSGERLFRYPRDNRPDINAWFVLERGVPDWERLVQDGYGGRLIDYGGLAWRSLLVNAKHLISSHIDVPVHDPPGLAGLPRKWKFTFLQHGVIKDNLSNWLNLKKLDLFVTSTADEYASIVSDGTPYVFTEHEVALTGLPRFDRQRSLGSEYGPDRRDLLLIAPIWRHWLSPPLDPGSQRRVVRLDFLNTEYARNWLGLLRSTDLAELCAAENLTRGFLPHPNIQPILADLDLPEYVEALTFHGQDVQRLFARSAMIVTDYSSMAFNAAYIDRPVVYFQFDRDEMFGGGHVGRGGYFSYDRDGFGPVAETVDEAVSAVAAGLSGGRREPGLEYLARIQSAFPIRDGRCCERVTAAIERL